MEVKGNNVKMLKLLKQAKTRTENKCTSVQYKLEKSFDCTKRFID